MLDSTAAVAAEREGKNARELLESVASETDDDEIAVSVVGIRANRGAGPKVQSPARREYG
jgi:hypothetical protein